LTAKSPSSSGKFWPFLLACILILGGAFLLTSFLSYPTLKGFLDALAPDGDLEAFTTTAYTAWGTIARWAGLALLLLGALMVATQSRTRAWIEKFAPARVFQRLRDDGKQLWGALKPDRDERKYLYALLAITALGALLRAFFLMRPMLHDEAYTFTAFASRSLLHVLGDYHLPNNHVFHTLLVHLTTSLLGNAPWVVRLPAYLAGVLTIPAGYLAGRALYGRSTALLSATLLAASPALVDYSTNARGYTLICLFTLLILALAAYLIRHRNLFAWLLLVVLSALGFHTNPVMFYPFGIVLTWLALAWLLKDVAGEYGKSFLLHLLAAGLLVVALTFLLYTPVLVYSGAEALFTDTYLNRSSWATLGEEIFARLGSAASQWAQDVPVVISAATLAGFALSFILHRRIAKHRPLLALAAFGWVGAVLVVYRVVPIARFWLFLLPLYLIPAAAGLTGTFKLIRWPSSTRVGMIILIAVALLLPSLSLYNASRDPSFGFDYVGVEEDAALFLKDYLQPGQLVVVEPPTRPQMLYYFMRHGLSTQYIYPSEGQFQSLIAVVSEKYDQTLESVLAKPDLADFSDYQNAQAIYHNAHTTLYLVTPGP